MARPIKKGLDYFPLDVDLIHDIKIRKIMRACGAQSIAVLVDLLGNIYGDEGYYMRWDDDDCFLVADDIGTSEAAVQEIVAKAVQVDFFDKGMYEENLILTSKGIQERYKMAAKKKKDSTIDPRYQLPKIVSSSQNEVSGADNSVSGADNQQRKEKESKVNKSKDKPDPRDKILREFTEKVWNIYPKKIDFKKSYDAYYSAKLEGVGLDKIVSKINEYKAYLKLNGTKEFYTKNLASWLRGRGWMDEYDMTPPDKPNSSGSQTSMSKEAQSYVRDDF